VSLTAQLYDLVKCSEGRSLYPKGYPMSSGKPVRVLSLFTGAGGLDIGFHLEGFHIVGCSDISPLFCRTLERNKPKYFHSDCQIICADIRDLDYGVFEDLRCDFVIGGPPCQTFSAAGRRAGGAPGTLDERGTLFGAYCRLIDRLQPAGFLFENVRGILGSNKGQDWIGVLEAFGSLGYKVAYRVLDACDYGSPQHRERLILVGHRQHRFWFPRPTHGPDSPDQRPHVTAAEAFQGLPPQPDDGHFATGKYSFLVKEVPPGGNYLHFTANRGYPKPIFAYRSRFSDFLYKAHPDKPTKTIIANPGKYSGPLHWESRRFTIPEYKRLQGFPDDYEFEGNFLEVVEQIGNSVIPVFARMLARAVAKQLFGIEKDVELMPPDYRLSFDARKGAQARLTRAKHLRIASAAGQADMFSLFRPEPYSVTWQRGGQSYRQLAVPAGVQEDNAPAVFRIACQIDGPDVNLDVIAPSASSKRSNLLVDCKMTIWDPIGEGVRRKRLEMQARLYSRAPQDVQTLWDAIDDFVIRSSSFHSLFELYGHFTEPHPIFTLDRFEAFSDHPILKFGKHASDFANCSKLFPVERLREIFREDGRRSVLDIIEELRSYRYDVRCHETNVAIPKGWYMVAYPFTLPLRKQMNFRVRRNIAG
jgi:DNA (cytosine-5)-methyltransferase 1